MDEWWDCERLDEFFKRILEAQLKRRVRLWTTLGGYSTHLIRFPFTEE